MPLRGQRSRQLRLSWATAFGPTIRCKRITTTRLSSERATTVSRHQTALINDFVQGRRVFRGVRGGGRACLSSIDHTSDVPTVAKPHQPTALEHAVFMISIDPHKGSDTAAAVDQTDTAIVAWHNPTLDQHGVQQPASTNTVSCSVCWPSAITRSPCNGPARSAGCTPCCVCWSRAERAVRRPPPKPKHSWSADPMMTCCDANDTT